MMRIRLSLAILWTIMILAMCWTPADWLPVKQEQESSWLNIPHFDKIVHGGLFVVFAVLWMGALAGRAKRIAWVAAAGLFVAAISELGQLIPAVNRDGELMDFVADSTGVLVGLAMFLACVALLEKATGRPVEARAR